MMSICQQANAARRKSRQDLRFHTTDGMGNYRPKKGRALGGYTSVSARYAAARGRKRVQKGGRAGSIGYNVR